jgi:hypothetical protein
LQLGDEALLTPYLVVKQDQLIILEDELGLLPVTHHLDMLVAYELLLQLLVDSSDPAMVLLQGYHLLMLNSLIVLNFMKLLRFLYVLHSF